ncbi:MAG: mammalian cell entry protein [Mycobacterium sp.]|nr:mammalian cell entry protein [Mycobacterium sp.]
MADDAATPDEQSIESTDATAADRDEAAEGTTQVAPARSPIVGEQWALVAGLIAVVVLTGLVGWLGFRAHEGHNARAQRALFLQVARQCAVNLTTVDYEHADADAHRILDLATGTFYDNFSRRSRPFVDTLKQGRQKSVGTVTEAGLESQHGNEGQVLVAVTVKSTTAAVEQQPQQLPMRLTVMKIGDRGKVSKVAFVS